MSMKFSIHGKVYDAEAGLQKVSLQTLFELKTEHNLGMKSLAAQAEKFQNVTDPMDILEDAASFKVFLVVIWLARKHAGENLTLEEANSDFGIADLQFVIPEDVPESPKAPADSAADVSPAPPTT